MRFRVKATDKEVPPVEVLEVGDYARVKESFPFWDSKEHGLKRSKSPNGQRQTFGSRKSWKK